MRLLTNSHNISLIIIIIIIVVVVISGPASSRSNIRLLELAKLYKDGHVLKHGTKRADEPREVCKDIRFAEGVKEDL